MKMKYIICIMIGFILTFMGCKYETPLSKENKILIDSSVLGLWELIPDEKEKPNRPIRMLVLQFSDTEYLILYSIENEEIYVRAYPIKIEDLRCVQLQIIGLKNGPIENNEKKVFDVASYQVLDGELEIRVLNSELVDGDFEDTEALKNALLKNKNDPKLFGNPGRFKKII